MRLGKEQATGYVEDVDIDAPAAEAVTVEHVAPVRATPAPEAPVLAL